VPNAFAMGRSPKNATVCVTTGILQLLSPAELEGVLAHELTHVQNRDVVVMTLASFFATIAAYIVQFGFFFGGDDDSEEGGIGVLGLILVSLVVYAVSFVLLQALSRYREYAADRGSAIITGRPSALASALLKIAGASERIPAQDLRSTQQLKAFYIYWPPARELIASHPSTEKRIEALQRLEAQLQGVPAAA
jgi:heat shock protein HtpX